MPEISVFSTSQNDTLPNYKYSLPNPSDIHKIQRRSLLFEDRFSVYSAGARRRLKSVLTVNTSKDLCRFNRASVGVEIALVQLQQIMDTVVANVRSALTWVSSIALLSLERE